MFIIDQSGTDTVQELGTARLSLYSRVYHHQLTRNAEAHLHAALAAALTSDAEDTAPIKDFLDFWTYSDSGLLELLSGSKDVDIKRLGEDLAKRKLLKRSAVIGNDLILTWLSSSFLGAETGLIEALRSLRNSAIEILSSELQTPAQRSGLVALVTGVCKEIKEILHRAGVPASDLPIEAEPPELRFLAPPRAKDAVLPQALVLAPSRQIVLHTTREI